MTLEQVCDDLRQAFADYEAQILPAHKQLHDKVLKVLEGSTACRKALGDDVVNATTMAVMDVCQRELEAKLGATGKG